MSTNTIPTKQQLKWQCRRGLLELDVVFAAFLEQHFDQLNSQDQQAFVTLLKESDPILQSWILNGDLCPVDDFIDIIQLLRFKTSAF